jgi:hypothetical protein
MSLCWWKSLKDWICKNHVGWLSCYNRCYAIFLLYSPLICGPSRTRCLVGRTDLYSRVRLLKKTLIIFPQLRSVRNGIYLLFWVSARLNVDNNFCCRQAVNVSWEAKSGLRGIRLRNCIFKWRSPACEFKSSNWADAVSAQGNVIANSIVYRGEAWARSSWIRALAS